MSAPNEEKHKRRKARRRPTGQALDGDQTKPYRSNHHLMFNTTQGFYYFVTRIIIINFVQITSNLLDLIRNCRPTTCDFIRAVMIPTKSRALFV